MTPDHKLGRWPLQLKLTLALVLIVSTPLAMSTYLVDQLGKAAANVVAGEASSPLKTMEKATRTYRDLVNVTKRLHAEIADRLAQRPELIALSPTANLTRIINDEGLRAIALVRADGHVVAEAELPLPGPEWRDTIVERPLGATGATLRLTFPVSATINEDLEHLQESIKTARTLAQIRTALPDSYRTTFLALLAVAALLAAGIGLFAARFLTRRLNALVSTARRVSEGKLESRVELRGTDELAELGSAFNTMLDDLDQTRAQVEYLQRMGVWQDVARRLAHEIKNPLTPIQLAVQQCVSSYKGDDARFQRLLVDTGEIVGEEIASLRRLVDTFRTLGALPKVEKAPLALAEVIDELKLDPAMAQRLIVQPPDAPVTVRADKLLLKRVLANLVENAIHAGEEAGGSAEVVIGWTADPRRDVVAITVDDHGKGVADANREKIFEPYMTTKSTGTGLGLAIARKIAIEHGGDLVLAPDRAPTGGARFVVSLPSVAPKLRSLSLVAIAACAPTPPPVAPAVDPDTAVFHDWKITDHVLGDQALIGELDAAGFHGRTVVVAPASYSSPWTGSCDDPHRSHAPRPLAEIARRYHVANLALPEPITEFHLTCGPDDGSSRVPPLSLFVAGERAAVCWSGVCYLLSS